MPYSKDVKKILYAYLTNLEKKERTEFLLLAKKWGVISSSLEETITKLVEKMVAKELTENQLFQSKLYIQFLKESKTQVINFSKQAGEIIADNQLYFAKAGISSTVEEFDLLGIEFNKLPLKTINNFIGVSKEGTPLFNLLQKSYPETVTKLTNTLLKGVALGYNPTKTANLMKIDMNGNLTRALRIARTEQMNIFRETSLMQMSEAGLENWEWLAESDACEFCSEQNGKEFPLSESMDTHPNCRCATLPVV